MIPKFPVLLKISTSDTDPEVVKSVDLVMVCPINLFGSPDICSATTTSLRIYSADDGLIRKFSKSTILGVIPYKTLNKMRNDSSVPLDLYNDLDSFIKLLTSILSLNLVSSSPGVIYDLTFW